MAADRPGGSRLAVDVLGPLVVSVEGRPVAVTARRLRTTLVVLAMSAGEDVSVERYADQVWGEDPPPNVRRVVQLYVMRLRRLLGQGLIRTVPAGYRLDVDPRVVDAVRFERTLERAATACDDATERMWLTQALSLWRGTPFDGVCSAWLETVELPRLRERYLVALERRIELDLAAGQAQELVAHLRELTARYPLRERLWDHLMTALYHSGQQADALEAYQRLYRVLVHELGIEPGHRTRDLHRKILSADAAPTESSSTSRPAISQLPRDVADFTGRTAKAQLPRVNRARLPHRDAQRHEEPPRGS